MAKSLGENCNHTPGPPVGDIKKEGEMARCVGTQNLASLNSRAEMSGVLSISSADRFSSFVVVRDDFVESVPNRRNLPPQRGARIS